MTRTILINMVIILIAIYQTKAQSTTLLKDLNLRGENSSPSQLTVINNSLFFTADSSRNFTIDPQLWKTDGTAQGTQALWNPTLPYYDPEQFIDINNELFFIAATQVSGKGLWKTSSAQNEAILLKSFGSNIYNISELTNVNGILFFVVDNVSNYELWKSDGSASGTVLVQSFPNGTLTNLTASANNLYFVALLNSTGYELWKSDGSAGGTNLVKDIYTGSNSSNPYGLTDLNGSLLFFANNGVNGDELWKSDGSTNGTVMVKDIYSGSISSPHGRETYVANGLFYFFADDGVNGNELWKSDGSANGTVRVSNIAAGSGSLDHSYNTDILHIGNQLYFLLDAPSNGLWTVDLVTGNSNFIQYIYTPNAYVQLAKLNGTLYFSDRYDLYKLDNTNQSVQTLLTSLDGIENLTAYNNSLYFNIKNNNDYGDEIWKSNGTVGNLELLKDINPETDPSNFSALISNNQSHFACIQDAPFSVSGTKVILSDGTTPNTQSVSYAGYYPRDIMGFNNELFFIAADSSTIEPQIWKINTANYTASAISNNTSTSYLGNLIACGNQLFFINHDNTYGKELWRTNGFSSGTNLVADLSPGSASSYFGDQFASLNNSLLFTLQDGVNGEELWLSNGSTFGTSIVKDINSGSASSNINNMYSNGSKCIFTADDGVHGEEIWITDGTTNGTQLLKDITVGANSSYFSYPSEWQHLNNNFFFIAYDPIHGEELWMTDGTTNGTQVLELTSGSNSTIFIEHSFIANNDMLIFMTQTGNDTLNIWKITPQNLVPTLVTTAISPIMPPYVEVFDIINNELYFAHYSATFGQELHKLTVNNNIVLIKDIYAGSWSGCNYYQQTTAVLNNELFFIANNGINGHELWKHNPSITTSTNLIDNHNTSTAEQLKVYPNPMQYSFTIVLPTTTFKQGKAFLYNTTGQLIQQQLLNNSSTKHELTLPRAMPSGVYWIKVQLDDKVLTQKIIKQ